MIVDDYEDSSTMRKDQRIPAAKQALMRRPWRLRALAVPVLAVVAIAPAQAERYAIGLWGDLPYSTAQKVGFPT